MAPTGTQTVSETPLLSFVLQFFTPPFPLVDEAASSTLQQKQTTSTDSQLSKHIVLRVYHPCNAVHLDIRFEKNLIESSNSTGNGDFWSFWKMIVYDEEALQRQNLEDGRQDSSEFSGIKRANSNDNLRIKTNAHHVGLPEPPKSGPFRPPMKIHDLQKHKKQLPRLLHPALHRIPLHVRFGVNGFLSNVLFMIAYNEAVVRFSDVAPSSTIYSITYLLFIPVSHAFLSILVFGWPERYLPSLLSNTPIGVTAIVLGAVLTEYLDENDFNKLADDILKKNWKYLGYEIEAMPEKDKGEFYSSLLVLFVTGVWTYFLSVFVNSPVESSHKKEL